MKTLIRIPMIFASLIGSSHAEDMWFALDAKTYPPPSGTIQYPSADAACRVAYERDVPLFTNDVSQVLPYVGAAHIPLTANPSIYDCKTPVLIGGVYHGVPHIIVAIGEKCEEGQQFDFNLGRCVSGLETQERKQRGDPNDEPNNVPSDCQGNPINAAIGNKFQRDVDFSDARGDFVFQRFYNGSDGLWRHSYSASIVESQEGIILTFDDGRASAFSFSGDAIIAESSERGVLSRSGFDWTYTSPKNEALTFNGLGKLIKTKSSSGRVHTIEYGMDDKFNVVTKVSNGLGAELIFKKDYEDRLLSMTAAGTTTSYQYSDTRQLLSVTRNMEGKSATKSYLYEDPKRSSLLTGIVDERGIRIATWTYDEKGRAVSSEHAGGVDKVTIVYGDDDTTTVTNALGHNVTYRYATVAGARRMISVTGEPAPGCPIANSSFTYEEGGQIATKVDALGRITAFTYDSHGREILRVEAKGTPNERHVVTTWDGSSFRPVSITSSGRLTTFAYDAEGRLISTSIRAAKE